MHVCYIPSFNLKVRFHFSDGRSDLYQIFWALANLGKLYQTGYTNFRSHPVASSTAINQIMRQRERKNFCFQSYLFNLATKSKVSSPNMDRKEGFRRPFFPNCIVNRHLFCRFTAVQYGRWVVCSRANKGSESLLNAVIY